MFYWFLKVVLSPVVYTAWRLKRVGARNLPARGPVILASTHRSFMDSIFLPGAVLFRRITFVAKAEYFDSWKTRWFFAGAGQIPIRRGGGSGSDNALFTAKEDILDKGHVFGIYPEGTRSPDGRLYRGKTGAARLAIETGAPLVPVAIVNSEKVQAPGKFMLNFKPQVEVRFGAPLDVAKYRGWADEHAAARALTDDLMRALAALSGTEYVDVYAADVKAGLSDGLDIDAAVAAAAEKANRRAA